MASIVQPIRVSYLDAVILLPLVERKVYFFYWQKKKVQVYSIQMRLPTKTWWWILENQNSLRGHSKWFQFSGQGGELPPRPEWGGSSWQKHHTEGKSGSQARLSWANEKQTSNRWTWSWRTPARTPVSRATVSEKAYSLHHDQNCHMHSTCGWKCHFPGLSPCFGRKLLIKYALWSVNCSQKERSCLHLRQDLVCQPEQGAWTQTALMINVGNYQR